MIIKKYQGKTEEEALAAAKKELGDGVVVMNVKNVKRKGLFAIFKPQLVEVTVAIEEKDRYSQTAGRLQTPVFTPAQPAAASGTGQAAGIYRKSAAGIGNIEEKLDSLQSLLEKQLKNPEPEKEADGEENGKEKPAAEPETEKDAEMVRFMKLLYKVMTDNEVDEKYISQIMDEIEKVHKPGMPFDYALSNAYQKLILKFGKPSEIEPAKSGCKAVFFIGPTGVGKTTTIAKIASRFSVEDKKKVALLTADTYRIAAAEQLRTYANILEVPFRIIYTEEDMQEAIREFSDFDYVFVDTAGHSHQNEEQKDAMKRLVHSADNLCEKDVYLVLSATTKKRDLESIADSYKDMADYKLIFTKLDETTAIGNLLNLKLYTGADLSYVTCGQNVPDDIEKFNPQKMVKQLLGGK